MKKEMEDKNNALTVDEKAKNLAWRLVGPRGERRLIKGTMRDQEPRRQAGITTSNGRRLSSRGLNNRGPQLPILGRGRAAVTRSMRGAGAAARGGGWLPVTHNVEEDREDPALALLSGDNRRGCPATSATGRQRTERWTAASPHRNISSTVSECSKHSEQD